LFTDEEVDNYVNENFPGEISTCFNRLNIIVPKIDFWRYLILYKTGGIYLDVDSNINLPLDNLIRPEDQAIITAENNYNTYVQWALIFEKEHPILERTIEFICQNIKNNSYPNNVFETTGPQVYSKAIGEVHRDFFGNELEYKEISSGTDITYSNDGISYRIYGIDYNEYFTFKHPDSELLYSTKRHWKQDLLDYGLLKPSLNVDNVYICHYSKLTERKNDLIEHLHDNNIFDYQFVELFDKNEWDKDKLSKEYPNIFNNLKLNDSEISLALKHSWIIQDVYDKGYESALVFEDDVLLCFDFVKYFNCYIEQLPNDWDICWVGSCYNLHIDNIEKNKFVYKTDNGSRCTHAFMISKSFVKKVINSINSIDDAADHFYNKLVKVFNLNNYWIEPALAYQDINYQSSISGKHWPKELMQ
jgi:GR25 family glycosyltransferase involved in LPS biosynthesis